MDEYEYMDISFDYSTNKLLVDAGWEWEWTESDELDGNSFSYPSRLRRRIEQMSYDYKTYPEDIYEDMD